MLWYSVPQLQEPMPRGRQGSRHAGRARAVYLVNTMVGVTARLVYVAVKDHDLDDHVTEGE